MTGLPFDVETEMIQQDVFYVHFKALPYLQ